MKAKFNLAVLGTTVNKELKSVVEKLEDRDILLCDSETTINDIGVNRTNISTHLISNKSERKNNGIGFARNSIFGRKALEDDHVYNMKLKSILNGETLAIFSPTGGTGSSGFSHMLDFVDKEAIHKSNIHYLFPVFPATDEIGERKYYSLFVKAETTGNIGDFNFILVPSSQLASVAKEYSPHIHNTISSELINRPSSKSHERSYLILDITSQSVQELKDRFVQAIIGKCKQLLLEGGDCNNEFEFKSEINSAINLVKQIPEIEINKIFADDLSFKNISYADFKSNLEDFLNDVYRANITEKIIPLEDQIFRIIKRYGFNNCKEYVADIIKFSKEEHKKYSDSVTSKIARYFKQEKSIIVKIYYRIKNKVISYSQLKSSLQEYIYNNLMRALYIQLEKVESFFGEDENIDGNYDWVPTGEIKNIIDHDFLFESHQRIKKIGEFVENNNTVLVENYLLGIPHNYGFQINNSSKDREGIIILSDEIADLGPEAAKEFRIKFQKLHNLVMSDHIRVLPSNEGKIQVIFWVAAYKEEIEFYNKLQSKYNGKITEPESEVPPYYNSLDDINNIFPIRLRTNCVPQIEDVNLAFLYLILTPGVAVFRKKSFYINLIEKEFASLKEMISITPPEEEKIRSQFYKYFNENRKKVHGIIETLSNEKQQTDVRKNINKFIGPRNLKEALKKLTVRLKYYDKKENEAVF